MNGSWFGNLWAQVALKWVQRYVFLFKVLLLLLSGVFILFFFPNELEFKFEYRKNKPWMHNDLIAPFDFSIYKTDQEILKEKEVANKDLMPYYYFDTLITAKKLDEFRSALDESLETGSPLKLTVLEANQLHSIIDTLFSRGIIQGVDNPGSSWIQYIKNGKVEKMNRAHFFTITSADRFIQDQLKQFGFREITSGQAFVESFLIQNVIYEGTTTEKERQLTFDGISTTYGFVQKGERIISKGELVSVGKYQIINSLEREYAFSSGKTFNSFLSFVGRGILLFLLLSMLLFYTYLYDKNVFNRLKRVALMFAIFSSMVVVASLCQTHFPDYIIVMPMGLFAIVNKVFFSSRVAVLSFVLSILIIGTFVPNAFEFVFVQSIVGVIAILSLKSLYHRAQFLTTTGIVFVSYLGVYFLRLVMIDGNFDSFDSEQLWFYSISSILTLLAYPLLYVLERVFRIVTDFTLLELSNTNLPLLRELALKAPGTFHHSILVANIAEEVIHKINGNMLLVRVGALYHDIGKLSNPSFFIENQHGINPHDEISSTESAGIIINHVAEGVKLANRYKLPDEVLGFIRTHHGTRSTAYFDHKYMQENPNAPIDKSVFAYPGPSPRSKEEAVLMLADIFEAATRSMKVPTKENISVFVDNMIDQLIVAKQFNHAEITFHDLLIVKESFKNQLINMYHKRIEYPKI